MADQEQPAAAPSAAPKGGLDAKVWLAAILLVVGFFVGMAVKNGQLSGSIDKSVADIQAAGELIEQYEAVTASTTTFIQQVKANSPDAYKAALDSCTPKARKHVEKLAE